MTADVQCPVCGETVELVIDPAGGDVQEYVEDCEVCCRPWAIKVTFRAGRLESVDVEVAG